MSRVALSAPGGVPLGGVAAAPPRLYRLEVRELWRTMRAQPLAFWLLSFYLLLEYVRPQSLYPVIDVLPWGQLAILGTLAAHLMGGGRFRMTDLPTVLMLAYTVVVLASSVFAYSPDASRAAWSLWFSWVLVYLLVANIVTTESRFLVFMLCFLLYSLKMAQHAVLGWAAIGFSFRDWGATGAPGWFHNSGEFGVQMDVFMPLAAYFAFSLRRQLGLVRFAVLASFPVLATMGMIASSSRGSLVGGAAAMLWMLAKGRQRIRGLIGVVALAGLVLVLLPEEQKERFRSAGDDHTSTLRLQYWKDGIQITREHPALGIGYSNWYTYYTAKYNPHGEVPHNIFIQCMSELGLVGLAVLVLLIGGTFVVNARTRRLAARQASPAFVTAMAHGLDAALVGYLVSGFFVTVLYYPYFWINLALTAALHNTVRVRAAVPAGAIARSGPVLRGLPRPAAALPRGRGGVPAASFRPAQRRGLS